MVSVVFLGLPGLRLWTPVELDSSFLGRPGRRFATIVFSFLGLPGFRFGGVSAGFSFLGLPGLRFGTESSVEPFKESGVGVVVEIELSEFLIPSFSFLGRPGFLFIGMPSPVIAGRTGNPCSSSVGSTFRLPLLTRVKSGLTWYGFWLNAAFIRANLSAISRFV